MANEPLTLEAFCLKPAMAPAGRLATYVLARVRASAELSGPRPRLTAVLVLDVSGSMQGEPLDQVIRSAQRLTEVLSPDDSLGVVAFAAEARTVTPVRALAPGARKDTVAAVGTLAAGGGTNIGAGMAHAAGLFVPPEPNERQLAVVMSDGEPTDGAVTPEALAEEARKLKARGVAVSSLGYGARHKEDVLLAIADGGSGRYAFVDDPKLAGAAFARALGAQREVVGEDVRLTVTPSAGAEVKRVLGDARVSFGPDGLKLPLSDLLAGEELNIVFEVELQAPGESGDWHPLALKVDARLASTREAFQARAEVHLSVTTVGPFVDDPTALVAVTVARADELRTEARQKADRGDFPGAAQVLRGALAMIESTQGFVKGGAGPLEDAYDTLLDTLTVMEQRPNKEQYAQHRKASRDYQDFAQNSSKVRGGSTPMGNVSSRAMQQAMVGAPVPPARFVVEKGPNQGAVYPCGIELSIGRSSANEIPIAHGSLSKRHTRVAFDGQGFWLFDMKSTNGTFVNGQRVDRWLLRHGDQVMLGDSVLRFELG